MVKKQKPDWDKAALLGYGSHGHDIEAIWLRSRDSELELFDDDHYVGLPSAEQMPLIPCYVGVNDPQQRAGIVRTRKLVGAEPLIDPSAIVGKDCHTGSGTVIAPHATLLTDVIVGSHVHINYGVHMTRCTIGEFTTVCPGAIICGDVTIGREVFIGAGATVTNGISIGNRCVIGAGAVVLDDVPDDTTVVGVPARPVRRDEYSVLYG